MTFSFSHDCNKTCYKIKRKLSDYSSGEHDTFILNSSFYLSTHLHYFFSTTQRGRGLNKFKHNLNIMFMDFHLFVAQSLIPSFCWQSSYDCFVVGRLSLCFVFTGGKELFLVHTVSKISFHLLKIRQIEGWNSFPINAIYIVHYLV